MHCFWLFKQIQDCPSDVRSADPTAKQIIRSNVSLQTKNAVQWADRLPIDQPPWGWEEACLIVPPLSSPLRTGLLGTSPFSLQGFWWKTPEEVAAVRNRSNNKKSIRCAPVNSQTLCEVLYVISQPRSNSDICIVVPLSWRRKLSLEN